MWVITRHLFQHNGAVDGSQTQITIRFFSNVHWLHFVLHEVCVFAHGSWNHWYFLELLKFRSELMRFLLDRSLLFLLFLFLNFFYFLLLGHLDLLNGHSFALNGFLRRFFLLYDRMHSFNLELFSPRHLCGGRFFASSCFICCKHKLITTYRHVHIVVQRQLG